MIRLALVGIAVGMLAGCEASPLPPLTVEAARESWTPAFANGPTPARLELVAPPTRFNTTLSDADPGSWGQMTSSVPKALDFTETRMRSVETDRDLEHPASLQGMHVLSRYGSRTLLWLDPDGRYSLSQPPGMCGFMYEPVELELKPSPWSMWKGQWRVESGDVVLSFSRGGERDRIAIADLTSAKSLELD